MRDIEADLSRCSHQSVTDLMAVCVRAGARARARVCDAWCPDAVFCPSLAGVLGMLFVTSALATIGFGW